MDERKGDRRTDQRRRIERRKPTPTQNVRYEDKDEVLPPKRIKRAGVSKPDRRIGSKRLMNPFKATADYFSRIAETEELMKKQLADYETTLVNLAAYGDHGANRRLEQSGSYALFDEPNAVKLSREAINRWRSQ